MESKRTLRQIMKTTNQISEIEASDTIEPFTPGNIDEKRQEGEERRRQTDNGDDADEVSGERHLLLAEVHGGARSRAVLPPHECVTEVWVDLQLSRAPEAVVSLDSHGRLVGGLRPR